MAAKLSQSLQFCTWIDSEKIVRKSNPSLKFSQRRREQQKLQLLSTSLLQSKPVAMKVYCSPHNYPASVLDSGIFTAIDEEVILKNKAEEIKPYLNGRCIYLVGMMGSGKTTIGMILAKELGYSFLDSDKIIEQTVGGTSVTDIFKAHGESFFRDNETEVLRKLSSRPRLVVSTGGGAVIRPINWKYMKKGISVWLDVPLEALARRITAVGTGSRPLLHLESGDVYTRTFQRLCTLWEGRSEAYNNASARVSVENIAAKLGYTDVCNLTPNEIAIEALVQIEKVLNKEF